MVLHSDNNFDPYSPVPWMFEGCSATENGRCDGLRRITTAGCGTGATRLARRNRSSASKQRKRPRHACHGLSRFGPRQARKDPGAPGYSSVSSWPDDGLSALWLQEGTAAGSAGLGVAQLGAGAAWAGSGSAIGTAGSE
jgi:hypothetical protein